MRVASYSRFIPLSLVLMWLSLVPALAGAAENSQPLAPDEQAFLTRALSDNASQIAMAKLALQKSTNPRVVALANAIIQERTTLDSRLTQLLASKSAQAETTSVANGDDTLNRLQSLDGDSFDRTFTSSLVKNHCRMIAAYQAMKLTSSSPVLKDIAHDAIPALRSNLTVAMAVLRSSSRWAPSAHPQESVADTQPRSAASNSKTPVFWEPVSLVTAPW